MTFHLKVGPYEKHLILHKIVNKSLSEVLKCELSKAYYGPANLCEMSTRQGSCESQWDMWITQHSDGIVKVYGSKTTIITVALPFFYSNNWFDIMLNATRTIQQSLSNQYKGNLVNLNGIVERMMIYNLSTEKDCVVDLHFLYFDKEDNEKEYPHLRVLAHGFFTRMFKTSIVYTWQKVFVFSPKQLLYGIRLWENSNQITVVNMNKDSTGFLYYFSGRVKASYLPSYTNPTVSKTSYDMKVTYTDDGYPIAKYIITAKSWSYLKNNNESWTQASRVCKSEGAILPIIRSKKEQDDIINILAKNDPWEWPLRNLFLFIGLQGRRVSIWV